MLKVRDIIRSLADNITSHQKKIKKLNPDSGIALAESVLNKYLLGSTLLGLNKMEEFPEGYGNLLLFSRSDPTDTATMQLEVMGGWIWMDSSIKSLVISNDEVFPHQPLAALISQSHAHVGQKIIGIRLWEGLPHIALEFSDGSVFAIHGDNNIYESWAFDNWGPKSIGVYALPGGPIAVG
jgi:hypothetical protein